jgi:glutamate-1-semialdehyde 2,1-aminomutase
MAAGVPEALRNLTVKFRYNDLAGIESLFAKYQGQIACVVMEAETAEAPKPGFLQDVRQICHEHGALFILDEIITGFRWHLGGAQKCYNVTPDMSTFGKALGNGYSISALVGKRGDSPRQRTSLLALHDLWRRDACNGRSNGNHAHLHAGACH